MSTEFLKYNHWLLVVSFYIPVALQGLPVILYVRTGSDKIGSTPCVCPVSLEDLNYDLSELNST